MRGKMPMIEIPEVHALVIMKVLQWAVTQEYVIKSSEPTIDKDGNKSVPFINVQNITAQSILIMKQGIDGLQNERDRKKKREASKNKGNGSS